MRKKKNLLMLFILMMLSALIIVITPNYSLAWDPADMDGFDHEGGEVIPAVPKEDLDNPIINPDFYKPNVLTDKDTEVITNKANQIVGVIVTVGVVASAITLAVLGIKYMLGSVEEKAEYKKSMMPYIIGVVILLASSTIVSLIANIVQQSKLGG